MCDLVFKPCAGCGVKKVLASDAVLCGRCFTGELRRKREARNKIVENRKLKGFELAKAVKIPATDEQKIFKSYR